jgi:hypothetical protein
MICSISKRSESKIKEIGDVREGLSILPKRHCRSLRLRSDFPSSTCALNRHARAVNGVHQNLI